MVFFVLFFVAISVWKLLFFLKFNFSRSVFRLYDCSWRFEVYDCLLAHGYLNVGEFIWAQPPAEIIYDDLGEAEVGFSGISGFGLGDVEPDEEVGDDGEVFDLMQIELFELKRAFPFFRKHNLINLFSVLVVACPR